MFFSQAFKCEQCGLEMKTKRNLLAHEKTHNLDRALVQCRACKKEFTTVTMTLRSRFAVLSSFSVVAIEPTRTYEELS